MPCLSNTLNLPVHICAIPAPCIYLYSSGCHSRSLPDCVCSFLPLPQWENSPQLAPMSTKIQRCECLLYPIIILVIFVIIENMHCPMIWTKLPHLLACCWLSSFVTQVSMVPEFSPRAAGLLSNKSGKDQVRRIQRNGNSGRDIPVVNTIGAPPRDEVRSWNIHQIGCVRK